MYSVNLVREVWNIIIRSFKSILNIQLKYNFPTTEQSKLEPNVLLFEIKNYEKAL